MFSQTANGAQNPNNPPSAGAASMRKTLGGLLKNFHTESHKHHPALPMQTTYDRLREKHADALQELRLSEADVQRVLDSDHYFAEIQSQLRNRRAVTDALIKQIAVQLVSEQLVILKKSENESKRHQTAEAHKLQIQRELAEARIKARQALKLNESIKNEDETEGNDGDKDTTDNNDEANHPSPTSVANLYRMPESSMGHFQPGLVDDLESDDGDIQEVDSH